jgi:predicted RNA binding protein YcfA (HicA-like mRNA interferase family)
MIVKISIPIHGNKYLKIGLLRHLLKQAELFDYLD